MICSIRPQPFPRRNSIPRPFNSLGSKRSARESRESARMNPAFPAFQNPRCQALRHSRPFAPAANPPIFVSFVYFVVKKSFLFDP